MSNVDIRMIFLARAYYMYAVRFSACFRFGMILIRSVTAPTADYTTWHVQFKATTIERSRI